MGCIGWVVVVVDMSVVVYIVDVDLSIGVDRIVWVLDSAKFVVRYLFAGSIFIV